MCNKAQCLIFASVVRSNAFHTAKYMRIERVNSSKFFSKRDVSILKPDFFETYLGKQFWKEINAFLFANSLFLSQSFFARFFSVR